MRYVIPCFLLWVTMLSTGCGGLKGWLMSDEHTEPKTTPPALADYKPDRGGNPDARSGPGYTGLRPAAKRTVTEWRRHAHEWVRRYVAVETIYAGIRDRARDPGAPDSLPVPDKRRGSPGGGDTASDTDDAEGLDTGGVYDWRTYWRRHPHSYVCVGLTNSQWIELADVLTERRGFMSGLLAGLLIGGSTILVIVLAVIYRDAIWRFLRRRREYQDRD